MARRSTVASSGYRKLEGLDELKRNLESLGTEVSTKVGRAANRKAANVLAEIIRERAPYRPGVQLKFRKSKKTGTTAARDYGDLRDNIKVRLVRARTENTITYAVHTGAAFWAFFLEFGTRFMSARPFMRPAFDEAASRLIDIQIAELRSGVERAAKRLRVKRR